MLHKCSSLTKIDLAETEVGFDGFRNMIRGVGHFSQSVNQMSFRGCNLGSEAAAVLFPDQSDKMFPLPTVTQLDLSYNCKWRCRVTVEASAVCETCAKLVWLFSGTAFNDEFAFKLAKALPSNSSLAVLDLRQNHFSEAARKVPALPLSLSLSLSLFQNVSSTHGLMYPIPLLFRIPSQALAEAAASHATLKALPTETDWVDTRNVCARTCDPKDCIVM
jgi:hypothetical protein